MVSGAGGETDPLPAGVAEYVGPATVQAFSAWREREMDSDGASDVSWHTCAS